MKVSELISRVRDLLQDEPGYRWTDADLLNCYNEALIWIVQQRPDTNSEVMEFTCEQRSRQIKPDDTYRILGPVANTDTGRAIQSISMDQLNGFDIDWSNAGFNGYAPVVEFMMYDERTPDVFWLYPYPDIADHKISISVSRVPTLVTDPDISDIEIPLFYLNPLRHCMLAYAYMTDAETEANMQQAQNYLRLAASDLGLTWSIDLMFSNPISAPQA